VIIYLFSRRKGDAVGAKRDAVVKFKLSRRARDKIEINDAAGLNLNFTAREMISYEAARQE
jgi:hypothetical protein